VSDDDDLGTVDGTTPFSLVSPRHPMPQISTLPSRHPRSGRGVLVCLIA
jgi:hypothetical protein